MKVYVVTNGTGGVIDSVWSGRFEALERVDALNAAGGEALAYHVEIHKLDRP